MAKKKPQPGGKKPNRRPPPPPADVPDRRGMEGVISQFTAKLQGRASPLTPAEQAQNLLYDAFEQRDPARRVKMARESLAIDPDRADAYVLLAEHTHGRKERLDLYEKGVAAGERAIGPKEFKGTVGMFWGVLETRPYMRARLGLATTLWEFARRDEAVGHLQDMLRLNPNDNQGVRYILAGFLLFLDRDEELDRLLDRYREDGSAVWAYTAALLAFRREGNTIASRRLLKAARKVNRFAPGFLLGDEQVPLVKPDYYSPGDENEAMLYAEQCLIGWKSTDGAIAWLRGIVHTKKAEGPKGKGPLGFVKKWLTTHLASKDDVWQADFRQLPNWLRLGGVFSRPWVVLVTNPGEEAILAHEIVTESPPPALLWDAVLKAMQHPAAGTPHRPAELRVPPGQAWESLRPHFEEVGIRLETAADVAELDEVFAAVYEQVCGAPEPGLLDIEGVTPERARAFYDAAAGFFRQAPWKRIGHEAAIRVECDAIQDGPWFAVVIGLSGMTTGVALYHDLGVLQGLQADASDEENARRSVSTAVTFGEPWTAPVADIDAAKEYGWAVAREDAYPHAIHTDGDMEMRPPLSGELDLLEACLRALPEFLRRRRQDDETREEVAVETAAGPVKVTLAWVPESVPGR